MKDSPLTPEEAYERLRKVFKEVEPEIQKEPDYVVKRAIDALPEVNSMFSYKYKEDNFMNKLWDHVNATYSSHYGGNIQPVEFIMNNAETLDYLKGNVVKYVYRYGKKDGHNVNDLLKACHFIMMMAMYEDKK